MSYKHFTNKECEYYPCHCIANQNCLFCYCPLYFMEDCGGTPQFHKGIKDCSDCILPHDEDSFENVSKKQAEYFDIIKEKGEMVYIDKGE